MPDIEFQEIIGEIEDTALRQHEQLHEQRLDGDPEKLRRMIRAEQARAIKLAQRLMA